MHLTTASLGLTAGDELARSIHELDNRVGLSRGADRFRLLTHERRAADARAYAHRLIEKAAARCGLERTLVERITIEKVVARERCLTGSPQRVSAPPADYRSVAVNGSITLRALHEGPTGEWIAYLDPHTGRAWIGRSLPAVLHRVFDLPHGACPQWVGEIIETLAGRKTTLGVRYPCPCCDLLTLTKPPPGTHATCPVCRWEDDNLQFRILDYPGGANRPSLLEARETYRRLGVSKPRRRERARPPRPSERA